MIQTTHVGSLPFKTINDALEYTFRWDIPALFTLPNFDSRQYMGQDILTLLGIEYINEEKGIRIAKDYFRDFKKIKPFYLDEFLRLASHQKKGLIKYQIIGPITLYSLLSNKDEINFTDFCRFLQERYCECARFLRSYHSLFLVIDEPLLKENITFYQDSDFLEPIENFCEELYVHCCDRIDLVSTENLERKLHLDLKLFHEECQVPKNCEFVGVDTSFFDKPKMLKDFCADFKNIRFISPACGLANSSLQETETIFSEITLMKDFLNLQDHQN